MLSDKNTNSCTSPSSSTTTTTTTEDETKKSNEKNEENWIPYHSLDKARFTVLLAGASGLGSLISHPFYVLTTRQQAGTVVTGDKVSSSFSAGLKNALHRIGWSGLFRGWVPMAAASIPSNVIYLTVIEKTREQCSDIFKERYPDVNPAVKDAAQAVYSGVIATFVYQALFNPAEVLVSRMIVQNKMNRTCFRTTSKMIFNEEKFGKGFFRGYSGSFGTGLFTSIIWWWAYSASRRFATSIFGRGENEAIYVDGFAGLCAGISETIIIHPFDSIRARIMTGAIQEPRYFRALHHVCKTEGFGVLWKGLYPSMCHTLWSSTIFALCYELIKRNSPKDAFAAFEESLE